MALALIVALFALSGPLERVAQAQPRLGALEEPGEVERTPVQAGEANPTPGEAVEILPDSEAVDPTIPDESESEASADSEEPTDITQMPIAGGGPDPSDEAAAEDAGKAAGEPSEPVVLLPDSESVDPTLDGESEKSADDSPAKTEQTAEPEQPEWSIRWQNAFIVERVDDSQYQFLFGGRIQNDWGAYLPDSDLERDFGGDGTGTIFRRARLYFQGQFYRLGFFKAEYDFATAGGPDGDPNEDFADVYMGVRLPTLGLLRVGHFKEPISLQFLNSSNFLSFNERAAIQAFSPGRNVGAMVNGNFLIRDSTYAIAILRNTGDQGVGFANDTDYRITTRITRLPYFEDGGRRLLHLEISYSHQFADDEEGTRYQAGPVSSFAEPLVDTGDLSLNDVDLFNFGAALVEGSFSLQSEVMTVVASRGTEGTPVFWGAYLEASWWLTGEHRRYLRGRGVFSRVVPKKRYSPGSGTWGAFEVATRYSWLDLSNEGVRGGTLGEWSLAFNWVLLSNLRVSTNYGLSHTGDRPGTDSGIAHTWVTRFQVDF